MTFPLIYATLKSHTQLPQELQTQTDDSFTDFFTKHTRAEKVTLNACKQRVVDACKKLQPIKTGQKREVATLCEIAITNLRMISDRQRIYHYFDGTEGDLPSFRSVVSKFKDLSLVRVALPFKEQFDCPHTRLKLLYFLQRLLPEQRESTAPFAVSILTQCQKPDHVDPLFGILADIQEPNRGQFIKELSEFVFHIPSQEWQDVLNLFYTIPEALRFDTLHNTLALFPAVMQSDSREVKAALIAASELWGEEAILALSRQLTQCCHDGRYIAAIVRHIRTMKPEERQDVVERVVNLMVDANEGVVFFQTLQKLTNLAPLQRDWVTRAIGALLGDFSRENGQMVLQVLHQVEAAPSVDEIMQYEIVIPDEEDDPYRFQLALQDLYDNPIQVLHNLVELFDEEKKSAIKITFLDAPAVDDGGPSQQFFTILSQELCKKLKMELREANGLYRPHGEQRSEFEALGKLFAFLLRSDRQYLIGKLFDRSVFVALSELSEDHSFKALFAIYEKMNSEFSEDQNAVRWMKQASQEDVMPAMMQWIAPCIAIKRGMGVVDYSQDELMNRLQGSVDNEYVVSQLQFDVGIPQHKRQWIQEWLLSASGKTLQQFLFSLTGGRSLGHRTLLVKNAPANVNFHTCGNPTLEIPFASFDSKELLVPFLEGSFEKFTNV